MSKQTGMGWVETTFVGLRLVILVFLCHSLLYVEVYLRLPGIVSLLFVELLPRGVRHNRRHVQRVYLGG